MNDDSKIISVLDLVERQKQSSFLATIEATDKEGLIKVTPYFGNGQCGCDSSIIVSIDTISKVELTGDRHLCCGNYLEIVRISFKDDAQTPIADILSQLMKRKSNSSQNAGRKSSNFPSGMNSRSRQENRSRPIRGSREPGRLRGACGDDCQTVYYGCGSCGEGLCLVECYCNDEDYFFCEQCC